MKSRVPRIFSSSFFRILRIFKRNPIRLGVLKRGRASRVIFFYPGEEGTYIEQVDVTLYENGIVYLKAREEEITTHLQNCEILWHPELAPEEWDGAIAGDSKSTGKVRLIRPIPLGPDRI